MTINRPRAKNSLNRTVFDGLRAQLAQLRDDGLVEFDDEWISVTPAGRLLVRAVCMVFDRYLNEGQARARYSRVL